MLGRGGYHLSKKKTSPFSQGAIRYGMGEGIQAHHHPAMSLLYLTWFDPSKTQFFSWGGGNVDLIYEPDFVELSFLGL